MPTFVIVGHTARSDGDFSLNDLPGSGGRMDLLCRCLTASLFLSHGIRRDVESYLILSSGNTPKTVRFSGENIISLSPDERCTAALIKRALLLPCGSQFREASPGVSVRKGGLERVISELHLTVMDEGGLDIRRQASLPENYLLSDHQNLTEEECTLTEDLERYSVGPLSLHADHAITVLLNERDRRRAKWE